jgi:hypothetical protein
MFKDDNILLLTYMIKRHLSLISPVKPWDDIENYYLDLVPYGWDSEPLVELVRHIKSSKYSGRIFGGTKMGKLIVSIYEEIIEWNSEALHIEFDTVTQQWHFFFLPQPFGKPEFERYYPREKGIEKFDAVIKLLKW